jgi:hypothetical protein
LKTARKSVKGLKKGQNMNRILVIACSVNKERNAGDTEILSKFKKKGLNILDLN